MTEPKTDPLVLLRKIQQASMQNTQALPQEEAAAVLWSGVGFRLADLRLVSTLDQVREILPAPTVTLVPAVKSWVKGVANIRGTLYTIVDLAEFFGKSPVFIDDRARIILMNMPGVSAALLVNEVLGLRHFDEEAERRQDLSGIDDPPVLAHLSGAFLHDDQLWGVFDMKSLSESETFRHVAA